jgi:hypothetical protein
MIIWFVSDLIEEIAVFKELELKTEKSSPLVKRVGTSKTVKP